MEQGREGGREEETEREKRETEGGGVTDDTVEFAMRVGDLERAHTRLHPLDALIFGGLLPLFVFRACVPYVLK
jgi:hypothetical protein